MTEKKTMTIVVCVKEVPYVYAPAAFDRKNEIIDQESIARIMNPFDEYALEWALHLKKKTNGKGKVVVLTFGEQRVREMLSYCLSLGADEAYLIREDDFPPLDAWTRALVLSKGVNKIGFDLVLCGRQAIDDNFGLVGGYLAGFLNLSWLSYVNHVGFDENNQHLICHRMVGKAKIEKVKASPPILLIAEKGGIELSYPTLTEIFNSRQKKIIEWKGIDLDLISHKITDKKLIQNIRVIPPKPKPMFTIDSTLSATDRLKMVISGGLTKKTNTKLLEGKKEDIVPKVAQYLIDQTSPF